MPPKKQEQQNSNPYIPFYVLPIFLNPSLDQSDAQKILRSKPINIKKCIDKTKIIEILKEKGLSQYLNSDSQIKPQGKQFICQNIKTVINDYIVQLTKPIDPKKDASKKDTKKEGKKQETALEANKDPIIELNFRKTCSDFHIYLDVPGNLNQLRSCIQNGMKVDVVVVIEEKAKKGSHLPDYNLLGRSYEPSQLLDTLNQTKIHQDSKKISSNQQFQKVKQGRQLIREFRKLKQQKKNFSHVVIIEIPFERNISEPQNSQLDFINSFFNKLCQITCEKQNYENWIINSVQKTPMIEPLKEIIKKEVQVEVQDKKAKKDQNKQPQFTIVEEIVQTKYENIPQNIKSNLKHFKKVESLRKNVLKYHFPLKEALQNCLLSLELQKKQSSLPSEKLKFNPQDEIKRLKSRPLIKNSLIQTLKQNLRDIKSFSNEEIPYNLINKICQIEQKVSLCEILDEDPKNKQTLQFQFMIRTISELMQSQQPKIKMNFSNRNYRERLNQNQLLSNIQKQLLKDPKVYEGVLAKDNIKFVCLAKINPPGRVLYLNHLFQPKAVPNFQNWLTSFKDKQNIDTVHHFYDYDFEDTGNLTIRKEIFTPTDNVTISDQKITIGSGITKVNYLSKSNTFYGIRKNNDGNNEFWIYNQKNKIALNAFQKQLQFKRTQNIIQRMKIQGSQQEQNVERTVETIQNHKRSELWLRTDHFIVSHTPYPSIYWLVENRKSIYEQMRRQFGPKGQITSYLSDGTIRILYLNGNISTFKNNRWEKIINGEKISSNSPNKKLMIRQLLQGDKTVKIRQDQTIFIQYSNGNSLIVFSDGTRVLFKRSQNTYQIKNFNSQLKEQVIIRVRMPRKEDFNIIGHGSAFAYLGFKNLIQRSYDGFLYEVWHNKFSTHLYNQKYEFQNQLYDDEIRLIYLEDGSFIKMEGQQHITYVQGDDDDNSQQKLKQKWNQLFTLEQNHDSSVYDVHLNSGTIQTRDSQSNFFKIHVEQENDIRIAVSFKINDEDKLANNYGNGFHVPQQNFFLPAPSNCLHPRIFSINGESGQYYEYLTDQQIKQMESSSSTYRLYESSLSNKTIKQYTRQVRHQQNFNDLGKINSFSKFPCREQFELPQILVTKQTRINMNVQNNPVEFRMIQRIQWNREYFNLKAIEERIEQKKQERQSELKSYLS